MAWCGVVWDRMESHRGWILALSRYPSPLCVSLCRCELPDDRTDTYLRALRQNINPKVQLVRILVYAPTLFSGPLVTVVGGWVGVTVCVGGWVLQCVSIAAGGLCPPEEYQGPL